MEIIDRKSFFEIEKQMEITPFTQGKGWDNYIGNKFNLSKIVYIMI